MQTTDIRKGLKLQIDGVPYAVVEHQFVKPGKGQAFTRARIRNLTTGAVIERTWKSGESVEVADVDTRKMTYSWDEGDSVVLQVTESEPGIKGDTASGATKPAKVSTGATVNVPLFIKEGEWVKVDTRTGDYLERVNK